RLEQVQATVEIATTHADTHAGRLHAVFAERGAALQALLAKRAVVIVAEQETGLGIASYVNVGPAIIVEIGRHCSQRIAAPRRRHAGLLAHVRERAIAIIAEQLNISG